MWTMHPPRRAHRRQHGERAVEQRFEIDIDHLGGARRREISPMPAGDIPAGAVDEHERIAECVNEFAMSGGKRVRVRYVGRDNDRRWTVLAKDHAAVSSSGPTRRPVSATRAPALAKAIA